MQVWGIIGGGVVLSGRDASGERSEAHKMQSILEDCAKVIRSWALGGGLMKILDSIWRRQKTSGKSEVFGFTFAMNGRPI